MHAGVLIRGRYDNVLRPDAVVSWAEIAAARHQPRGPAGSKDDEAPHKEGAAVVPILPAWGGEQCGCSGFAGRPQDRHRAKHAVRAMAPAIWLDVDEASPDSVGALLGRLDAAGLGYLAWTTHSYGRADKGALMALRLVVPAVAPYAPGRAGAVRRGFARAFEVPLDEQCLTPVSLFYLPSCPDDPARRAMARIWARDGARVDALDYAQPGEAEYISPVAPAAELERFIVPEVARRAPTRAEVLALIGRSGPKVANDLACYFLTGQAWGAPGERDTRLHIWARALLLAYPWIDPEATAEMGAASCAAVEREDNAVTTTEWVARKIRSKIPIAASRAWALEQSRREIAIVTGRDDA